MRCPACDDQLSHMTVAGVELDVCANGCGGIWFDQHEFSRFDEPREYAGDELLEIESGMKDTTLDHKAPRICPRCGDQKMQQHFYSPQQEIEIDECYMCGGVWLDYGELIRIRNKFSSDEARSAYARHHLHREFGEELDKFFKESQEKTEKLNRFAHMFRFLYPSWYLPDDQDWGKY